ncbi:MAG: copper amine oxidase N-terminal domain-containing protein [Armatimonadota bacterium]
MQKHTPWLLIGAFFAVLFTSGALTTRASAAVNYGYTTYDSRVSMVIPHGTVIPVTLDKTLSSATNHIGDTFTVTVRSQHNGDSEFPIGTKIAGIISDVQPKAAGQPGMIDVTFRQALLPGGQKITIQGSLLSLDVKSVSQTADGRITARDTKSKDRLKFIAIGTGAGLIIGKLTKNTLIGGVLGAIAGYVYSERSATKAADVTVMTGTVFGVQIDRDLTFRANRPFAAAREAYLRESHPIDYPTPAQAIAVTINGRAVALGTPQAYEDQGNIFIPLTAVMKAARIPFAYDERQQTVLVNTDRGELFLKIGKSYALLQGEKETLEAPAVARNGEVLVTPNYLALATNMHVLWDAYTRTVAMSYGSVPNTTSFAGQDITMTLKGQTVLLGTSRPFLVNGAIMVPLALVMDAAKVPYTYNEKWQSVRVDTDGGALYLNIGSTYALLEGMPINLETPAQVVDGEVYVPLRFLSLATGLTAKWNTRQQTVTLN